MDNRERYFFFTDVIFSGLIIAYLGVYIGACHLNTSFGLLRIEYDDMVVFDKVRKTYYIMLGKMFIGRFLLLTLMFLPSITLTIYVMQYEPKFITKSQSIPIFLISCILVYVTLYLIFLCFERISEWFKWDINQFEFRNRQDDVHEILEHNE